MVKDTAAADAVIKKIRSYVISLWSLFPVFCHYGPNDLPQTFATLSKMLQGVLQDTNYPEIHVYVYQGLNRLAENVFEKYPHHNILR